MATRAKADGEPLLGPTGYSIEHIPSGLHLHCVPYGQQRLAKGIVIDLLALPGIDWAAADLPARLTPAQVAACWEVCHPPPKPKPKRAAGKGPPVVLRPEYPRWFDPSPDLASLDAEIARRLAAMLNGKRGEGDPRVFVRDAAALAWEEMIVARFASGAKAVILATDAPPLPQTHLTLPPDFPKGYAGVRRMTLGLHKLGGEIDALAACMIDLWERCEGRPTGRDLDQWLAWDTELRRLIIKGWQNWAILCVLFVKLPAADKAKITDALGHVGGEREGWHAYGEKTFLRSPLLRQLREYRQAWHRRLAEKGYDDE